jgi:hypothetical protein
MNGFGLLRFARNQSVTLAPQALPGCAKESDCDACSLGLAAARLGVPALTSDGSFADADGGAEVILIR